jgi:protocatechuate 3,4-dioxygenase beta subunit
MKRFFVIVVCALSLLSQTRAQDATSPPNTVTLVGTVVKEPGSQPLKKVLLHLVAEDQKQGGNYTADTDSEGRFRIEKVQPGRYRLLLEKTGFHQINLRGRQADGSALTVQAGQDTNDLLFRMLPAAVITGKVVDEDGDPLPNYGVSLLRKRPGKSREPEVAGNERTNDLGEYRFGGLFPGQYLVAVVPLPDSRNFEHVAKDSDGKDSNGVASKPDLNYLITYYPGTPDSAQAGVVSLRAGDEMPVNFAMTPARTYRVRGIVTGIPANQKPIVQIVSKGVSNSLNGAEVAADGQFEVRGVAPGSYSIMVYSGSEGQFLTARQNVTVADADVEGVKLLPTRPFAVSGHLRVEGRAGRDLTHYTAVLHSATDPDDPGIFMSLDNGSNAQVDRFGNFQWTNVTSGNYVAQVFGDENPDTFLKSVTIGNSSADTSFSLTGPTSIELVIGSKGGMLEGVVLDNDKPASNATVVAVPEEKHRKIHERYGVGLADQNGRFTIHGLAPGIYTVFAWQDLDDGLYYDAAFLKSQESNGTALKIEEGSRQKIELKLSPVGNEWQ